MSLRVEVAGKSDVGCVRANNEDNFGYDSRYGIYVVCDGMGGAAAGEVASKMAVDTVLAYYRDSAKHGSFRPVGNQLPDGSPRANALASAIQLANESIFSASQARPSQAGMGATIVAVTVEDGFFSIGHVGDSRIYLIRGGAIQQLTNDHSLVMEQVRRGLITLEDAQRVDYQNVVIKALGAEAKVEPDLDDMSAMEGDVLLLCSDGLNRHVTDQQILDTITKNTDLDASVDALIEACKKDGGTDNITAVLLRFEQQSWLQDTLGNLLPGGAPKWQDSF
jgi:serine/threonine protein phosphatase PrpC